MARSVIVAGRWTRRAIPAPAGEEVADEAERRVACVRLGLVAFAVFVYYGIAGRPGPVHLLADAMLLGGLAYSTAALVLAPDFPPHGSRAVAAQTIVDGVMIAVFIYATGGADSPWFVFMYSSIAMEAIRHGLGRTFAVSAFYTIAYGAAIAAWGQLPDRLPEYVLRSALVAALAIVCGGLARDVVRQAAARRETRRRARDALRASTQNLRAVVEASPVALVALDGDGVVRIWNPAAERIFGWPQSEVLGVPCPVPVEGISGGFATLARTPSPAASVCCHRRDGAVVEASVSAAPLRDATGGMSGAMLAVSDVTDRRRLQRELDAARVHAVTREKLSTLGTLVAGVAHEIHNPLAALRASAALNREIVEAAATDPEVPGPLRDSLKDIIEGEKLVAESVEQIAHIAESIKQVARSPGSARQRVDVAAVAERVLTLAKPRLAGVTVTREFSATRPALAQGGEVAQVLLNLVLNAAEAMTPQGGRLTLRSFDVEGRVAIEVADSGPGIPDEVRARLFEPFHTTKENGTGLGLSVSRRIVEAHGGTITVESTPGKGATFRVELPAITDGA